MKQRTLVLAGLLVAVALGNATMAFAKGNTPKPNDNVKVFVCKYVGTPGVDERLKDGKQPIYTDSSATVGTWFNDAQGRSYVLAVATKSNTDPQGKTYTGTATCPAVNVVITQNVTCNADGSLVITLTNTGAVDGIATIDGVTVTVPAGKSVTQTVNAATVQVSYGGSTYTITNTCPTPGKGSTTPPTTTPTTPTTPSVTPSSTTGSTTTPVTKLPYTAGVSPATGIAVFAGMGSFITAISFGLKALARRSV